ncbi:Thioesterase [Paenibacillus curdlanolyticus YK9]|uniref:Thioesterase n=1 Tax=Paenibacillus curdlanolyticus YK9 TaxID=717606 RepID=E0I746_9BACL|nr:Thioesterase [Paenibacillus curdlanolyticus YK9]
MQLLSFLIRPLTDIPYVFFGHSLGSLIAYELARTLQEQAAGAPERLFISACNPPRIVGAEREERSPLHLLNDDTLSNALRQMNGTPHEVLQNDELMKVFLPIIKADFEMIDTYEFREGVALRCPLTVFAGTEDPIVSIEWLPKWAECTSSHLNMHAITGGHFYLKENEELFFQMLNGELDELLTGIEGVASSHGK